MEYLCGLDVHGPVHDLDWQGEAITLSKLTPRVMLDEDHELVLDREEVTLGRGSKRCRQLFLVQIGPRVLHLILLFLLVFGRHFGRLGLSVPQIINGNVDQELPFKLLFGFAAVLLNCSDVSLLTGRGLHFAVDGSDLVFSEDLELKAFHFLGTARVVANDSHLGLLTRVKHVLLDLDLSGDVVCGHAHHSANLGRHFLGEALLRFLVLGENEDLSSAPKEGHIRRDPVFLVEWGELSVQEVSDLHLGRVLVASVDHTCWEPLWQLHLEGEAKVAILG